MTQSSKKTDIFTNAKALLFDLDEPLADSMPLHYEARKKAAADLNIQMQA